MPLWGKSAFCHQQNFDHSPSRIVPNVTLWFTVSHLVVSNHLSHSLKFSRTQCFFVSHTQFPLQASFLCAPGYSKPTLPWPSHLLGGHLPGLLLPEQTAGHLLQRQFGSEPRGHWRHAAERLWSQVSWLLHFTTLPQIHQQIFVLKCFVSINFIALIKSDINNSDVMA